MTHRIVRIAMDEQFHIVFGNRCFKGFVIDGVAIIFGAIHRNSDNLTVSIASARIKGAVHRA